jgi:uncharacterized protein YgiM (DUF1202 family)
MARPLFAALCLLLMAWPTPSSAERSTENEVFLSANAVHIRSGPGLSHPILMRLAKGHRLIRLRRNADWIYVVIDGVPAKGWVLDDYVTEENPYSGSAVGYSSRDMVAPTTQDTRPSRASSQQRAEIYKAVQRALADVFVPALTPVTSSGIPLPRDPDVVIGLDLLRDMLWRLDSSSNRVGAVAQEIRQSQASVVFDAGWLTFERLLKIGDFLTVIVIIVTIIHFYRQQNNALNLETSSRIQDITNTFHTNTRLYAIFFETDYDLYDFQTSATSVVPSDLKTEKESDLILFLDFLNSVCVFIHRNVISAQDLRGTTVGHAMDRALSSPGVLKYLNHVAIHDGGTGGPAYRSFRYLRLHGWLVTGKKEHERLAQEATDWEAWPDRKLKWAAAYASRLLHRFAYS